MVTAMQKLRIPVIAYDAASGRNVSRTLYFDAKKAGYGNWPQTMLEAQARGEMLSKSGQWYRGRQWLENNNPDAERDFITGALEWTRDVLDYNQEALLTVDKLNPDGSIASAITFGKKDGFELPPESKYIKDMPDRCMKTISYLWGVENPKRELPDYAYLWVSPGFRPVVRGARDLDPRDDRRVGANAPYDAGDRRFAARFVSATKPQELEPRYVLSKNDYEALVAEAGKLEGADSISIRALLARATLID